MEIKYLEMAPLFIVVWLFFKYVVIIILPLFIKPVDIRKYIKI
jgi:hypothetical protein